MAKKSTVVSTGTGVVEKVGYNPHNYTSLICKGTSSDVLGSKFVVVIRDGEYSQYDNAFQSLVGKTVNFTFTSVNDVFVPQDIVFQSVE